MAGVPILPGKDKKDKLRRPHVSDASEGFEALQTPKSAFLRRPGPLQDTRSEAVVLFRSRPPDIEKAFTDLATAAISSHLHLGQVKDLHCSSTSAPHPKARPRRARFNWTTFDDQREKVGALCSQFDVQQVLLPPVGVSLWPQGARPLR